MNREVILAQPRGFCAGVERAITIVERALKKFGAPVHVYHEIVHNRHVVADLRARGAVFVEDLETVPPGAVCIFSAHGVGREVVKKAEARSLRVIDATCPLVTKVHHQAQRYQAQGKEVVIIGHQGHPEVEGTLGQLDQPAQVLGQAEEVAGLAADHPDRMAYVTQTTLSVDDTRAILERLRARFPAVVGPDTRDICYATQNRQNAVRALAEEVDLVLVVGSRNSSNSNRLCEVARQAGRPAYLIDDATDIDPAWLEGHPRVGVTAGASAPEVLVRKVVERLQALGTSTLSTQEGIQENTQFRLPDEVL